MSVKKVLLTISAMALIAVIAVAGTLAFLQNKTGSLKNTFASSGLIESDSNFVLDEAQVKLDDANYNYIEDATKPRITSGENAGVEYKNVLPGATLYKDPKITVTGLKQSAYLFVKVEAVGMDGLAYNLDGWTQIGDTNVWYKDTTLAASEGAQEFNVLANKRIKVADGFDASVASTRELTFTAYLAQAAGFDTAEAAWNATFGKQ